MSDEGPNRRHLPHKQAPKMTVGQPTKVYRLRCDLCGDEFVRVTWAREGDELPPPIPICDECVELP
jgi:hypothetical protein